MLSMLLYVIIIENSYNNNNNNNNNNVQNKVPLSKGSVAQCTQKEKEKKKKKRRGDVAHVRGTKNKIKPLT